MRRPALLLALVLLISCGSTTHTAAPDLILVDGKIFTSDDARPWAQALAIGGDRIAAVGNSAEIRALAGKSTRVIDLAGRVVVPGINDAHVHVPWGGAAEEFEVPETASVDELLARVTQATQQRPAGTWLHLTMPAAQIDDPRLTRDSLDAIAPHHPVLLTNLAGHAYLLNSLALRDWQVDENDPDPPGGRYGRDDGRLNGWLFEHAAWIKNRAATERQSDQELAAKMRGFANEVMRYGVTSVQSMPSLSFDRASRLSQSLGVPLRWRWMDMQMGRVAETPRWPVKYIFDGTPIERGAAMRAPYADHPADSGRTNYADQQIRRIVEIAARGDEPLLVHIAGDQSLEKLLNAMSAVDADWPSKRVRIEHGDFIARFADQARRLGVVVVQNPAHFMAPAIMQARFGPERMSDFQWFRSMLDRGIPVAIGSDGPINPWLNVMFAGMHPGNPSEAITREQAVVAYTRGSAHAELAEKEKGTLTPGKLADLAVLSQDIFTIPASELPKTESVMTIIGGRIAFERLEIRD